ncbi:hypothetical protein P3697_16620, partial [Vibrio parahaemolyticus]|nr:hypothetical protein [Vibrio parahaemolyticus]MDF5303646.1 hypothetical protein [Vibrio parahaemolyticus]
YSLSCLNAPVGWFKSLPAAMLKNPHLNWLGIIKILGRNLQIKALPSRLIRTFGYGNFFHDISKNSALM